MLKKTRLFKFKFVDISKVVFSPISIDSTYICDMPTYHKYVMCIMFMADDGTRFQPGGRR